MDSWRKMPKVCKGRSGAANSREYPKCGDPECTGWWVGQTHDQGTACPTCRAGDFMAGVVSHPQLEREAMPDTECCWCSKPASRLCDTMLRGRDDAGDLDLFRGMTCDAAICESCTTQLSIVHGSGQAGHWHDTHDACPYCAGRNIDRDGSPWKETDFVSADLWRSRVATHATKARRLVVGSTP